MTHLSRYLITLTLAVVILTVVRVSGNASDEEETNGLPVRPAVFNNPEELRDYLRTLNEYFAIVGRPRYSVPYAGLFLAN